MNITTKKDIGETVWFMKDNRPVSAVIQQIEVTAYDAPGDYYQVHRHIRIKYCTNNGAFAEDSREYFDSKEQLISSL